MKIAIYHHLPSGGALYHLHQVVMELKRLGHELHLFTPSTAELSFQDLTNIVDHHRVFPRTKWQPSSPITNPFRYRHHLEACIAQEHQWSQIIAEQNFDGIYLGQCQTWTEPPLLRFLPKRLPKILYCQEPKRTFHEERFLREREQWPWHKKLWRLPTIHWMQPNMELNIQCADLVLCNSEFSNQRIQKAYSNVTPVTSYIGVDTETFSPKANVTAKRQLLSVGALDPSKNHGFAIDVAAQKPAGVEFKVCIVTDRSYGDTAEQLKRQAQQNQVELEIRTRVTTEELAQCYRESFATVYTPLEEPFGIVSLESQACGTPVLGADEGGLKETIKDGVSGFLLPRKPELFTEKLAQWVTQPESRSFLSQSSRDHVTELWQKKDLILKTCEAITEMLF